MSPRRRRERNTLDAARRAPIEIEFELKDSRSGAPSLTVGGRLIHGLYDPVRDAQRDAVRLAKRVGRSGGIALIGSGLDLLPRALREQGVRDLIVYEPFSRLREALADALAGPRTELCTLDELEARLRRRPAHVVVHPGYDELVHFEQRFALRALRRGLGGRRREESVASERSFASLARLPRLRTLSSLEGCLAGRSVVIAAGGPSLETVLPQIARAGAIVLAAPQALDRLLGAGVRVDFVVSPDPGDWLTPVLGPEGAPFGALLADTSTHPDVLDRCPERCFLFQLRSAHLHHEAWVRAGLPILEEPVLTVAETALELALELGARRVLLAGVDLDAPNPLYGSPFRAANLRGELVPTNRVYFHAARYLSHRLPRLPDLEVRRVGQGLAIDAALPLEPQQAEEWLRDAACEARGAPVLPSADPGAERLRREVRGWLRDEPPPTTTERVAPIHDAWAGFEPMTPAEVAARWRVLRRALAAPAP